MADENCDCTPLINQTPTDIPLPEDTNCPEDQGCVDVLPAHCISVTNVDDCITNGQNLQELIDNIREVVCGLEDGSGNCRIKINIDDTCCGYLSDKILSDSLDITVESGSGDCSHIQIEEKCWEWNTINPLCSGTGCFKGKWGNSGGVHQVGQYSDVKECVVKLRGLVTNGTYTSTDIIITILPVGKRPLFKRTIPVVVRQVTTYYPAWIEILANGTVQVIGNMPNGNLIVPLDGVSFEID